MSEIDVLTAFHQRLTEKGLKTTRQRTLIVETFFAMDRHASVDDLLAQVRTKRATTGYATVYRTLKLLVELGFAHERHFGGNDQPTLYDPLYGREEHYHLICQDCQRIVEFERPELDRIHESIANELGFAVKTHRVELYAQCVREHCEHRPEPTTVDAT